MRSPSGRRSTTTSLDQAIRAISNVRPNATVRAQARRLFATALETPGGLKVQTIHAFCTRLLQQFPFEANVAARFTVLDETSEAELLNRTSMGVMLEAARDPDGPLGRALAVAISSVADQTFKDVVAEAIRKRDMVTKWIAHAGGIDAAVGELCTMLPRRPGRDYRAGRHRDGGWRPDRVFRVAGVGEPARCAVQRSITTPLHRLRAAAAASGEERANIYRTVFIGETTLKPRARVVTGEDGQTSPIVSRKARPGVRACSSGATPSPAAIAPRRC